MDVDGFLQEWNNPSEYVEVKTSGSTGTPKHMLVEKRRMLASAKTTCDFLGLKSGDTALLCMSADYIAGKMMVVRSIERQLQLSVVTPSNHPLKGMETSFDFIAMVPSQVFETMHDKDEACLLRQTKHLIIGGGAISAELEAALKDFPHCVWSTYGMTETLSHIALRRLNGTEASEWYRPFEGVRISLEDGCLAIEAPQICSNKLITNDIAEICNGMFRIKGRKDNVICSGGIKIQIEEVEGLLRPHLDAPFVITKVKDSKFGEAVVLLTEAEVFDNIKATCKEVLPRYWQPKHCFHVSSIPLTETGKPARKKAEEIAGAFASNQTRMVTRKIIDEVPSKNETSLTSL